jgi:hypothetical protein
MRNMLCTAATVMLIATSSLAFAQNQSAVQPTNGAPNPPGYGTTAPPQPGYGTGYVQPAPGPRLTRLGQPSLTGGIPGGNLPTATRHLEPGSG